MTNKVEEAVKPTLEKVEKNIWENETLKTVLKEIEKQFGAGAIMKLDDDQQHLLLETISSGSFLIDQAIGVGGYPKGRIVEIFGPESSGKTTLGLHAVAETQKNGGVAAYIDVEHSLDPTYAKNLGVNLKNFLVAQPDNGEQALDILEILVRSNTISLIVLDSVAALAPKAELDGEMGDQAIGLQARLMSKALRKLNGIIAKTKTVVIFINQVREKIGIIFGNPETTPGGRALRFYASLRLEVRRGEQISQNGIVVANKVRVKVVKNKVSSPFKTALITLNYNQGIDRMAEIVDLAVDYELIKKSGTWYSYQDEKIGQGKTSVLTWLKNDAQIYADLMQAVENKMNQE